MGQVVVLGEAARVQGFALGGATVLTAEDPGTVRALWDALTDDVSVVVLTRRAAAALDAGAAVRERVLQVVMPP